MQTPHLFNGGLAEIVDQPTELTYSFLQKWFTGQGSIGKAMKLLNLPYSPIPTSVLVHKNQHLYTNLETEEDTLYAKTIFTYRNKATSLHEPELVVSLRKFFSLTCLKNSLTVLLRQSQWIAHPEKAATLCRDLIDSIPENVSSINTDHLNNTIRDVVLPPVIATGYLCEFFNQLLVKKGKQTYLLTQEYISNQITEQDWFFRSIVDQQKVKNNLASFEEYIALYGLRADKDYELTAPRWYEIPDIIKKRIINQPPVELIPDRVAPTIPDSDKKIADALIQLLILRSKARRKSLIYIDQLRQSLLKNNGIINNNYPNSDLAATLQSTRITEGKGRAVSSGTVTGNVENITDPSQKILPQSICIFLNASPEFASQYSRCKGIIFLTGGQTSHGSIVAREFRIPAIIDSDASGLKDGQNIEINGHEGTWKVIRKK